MDRSHTFDNFHIHDGNEVALLAAKKIVEFPGGLFNPFYVFGGKGAGKTHLLRAINGELSKKCTTLFMSVKAFEKSINGSTAFDAPLIVDDLHMIGDDYKEKLLQIVERALNENIQLCFSADVTPQDIKNLSAKLCSYIESGLVCDLRPPEDAARIEIIKKKADEAGIILSDEVAEELAQVATGSIGTIESMINRLVAYSSLGNVSIDSNSIKMILQEFYPKKQVSTVSSVLEETKRQGLECWDIGETNYRDVYEKRMHVWEMRGFDVSSLKEHSRKDDSELRNAYQDFLERVRRLVELRDIFRTIDRGEHPAETLNIESMLLNPRKIDEIEGLLSGLVTSVEKSEERDNADDVVTEPKEGEEMIIPLGLPGEGPSEPGVSTEHDTEQESIDFQRVVPLSDNPPADIRDEKNYAMPDTLGELIEEKF